MVLRVAYVLTAPPPCCDKRPAPQPACIRPCLHFFIPTCPARPRPHMPYCHFLRHPPPRQVHRHAPRTQRASFQVLKSPAPCPHLNAPLSGIRMALLRSLLLQATSGKGPPWKLHGAQHDRVCQWHTGHGRESIYRPPPVPPARPNQVFSLTHSLRPIVTPARALSLGL